MTKTQTVLLVGGGSGGHILPLRGIASALLSRGYRPVLLTTDSALDVQIAEQNFSDLPRYTLQTGKVRAYASWENVRDFFRICSACFRARRLLQQLQPDILFLKGGFLCFPIVVAARYMGGSRAPIYLHESDLLPGRLTRFLAAHAARVYRSFDAQTPLPLFAIAEEPVLPPELEPITRPILLVTGGSQGAVFLNTLVHKTLPELTQRYHVVLVTGPGKAIAAEDTPHLTQYELVSSSTMQALLQRASVLLLRGGSNQLLEAMAAKKKAISIPHPHGRGYHQYYNARFFVDRGLLYMLEEKDATAAKFLELLSQLEADDTLAEHLAHYSVTHSAERIVEDFLAREGTVLQ